eukprot:7714794-Pyramimonas_sp.AAC.2
MSWPRQRAARGGTEQRSAPLAYGHVDQPEIAPTRAARPPGKDRGDAQGLPGRPAEHPRHPVTPWAQRASCGPSTAAGRSRSPPRP